MTHVMRRRVFAGAGAALAAGVATAGIIADRWSAPARVCAILLLAIGLAFVGNLLGATQDELRHDALSDPLTGLGNRRALSERIHLELDRAKRDGTHLAFLLLDLDNLKLINDAGGHVAGDEAIQTLALALRRTCRSRDLVVRYGGDELVVLAPETSAAEAFVLANRIRHRLAELARPDAPKLTASIGVADLERALSRSAEGLFAAADGAVYRAKALGRDRVALAPTQEGRQTLVPASHAPQASHATRATPAKSTSMPLPHTPYEGDRHACR
jgi:diguanylate cyclase (GGDEF)-like protein